MEDVFAPFEKSKEKDAPESISGTLQREKYFMALLSEHKEEIEFINGLIRDCRKERSHFYEEELPKIQDKLRDHLIDEKTREVWIERLVDNMERSFKMTEMLISDFMTKQLHEFKEKVEHQNVTM